MAHQSTMKRAKGCCLCKPHKFRDQGQSVRKPWRELREIGLRRRVRRHELGDHNPGDAG